MTYSSLRFLYLLSPVFVLGSFNSYACDSPDDVGNYYFATNGQVCTCNHNPFTFPQFAFNCADTTLTFGSGSLQNYQVPSRTPLLTHKCETPADVHSYYQTPDGRVCLCNFYPRAFQRFAFNCYMPDNPNFPFRFRYP